MRAPLLLLHGAMDADRGEIALVEQPVELLRARDRLDENDDLYGCLEFSGFTLKARPRHQKLS